MKTRFLIPSLLTLVTACPCPPEKPVAMPTPVQSVPDAGVVEAPPEQPEPPAKSPEQVYTEGCQEALAKGETLLAQVVGVQGARTVENTLDTYNELTLGLYNAAANASLVQMTHPNEKMREAARACDQEVSKFTSALTLNKDLFQAFTNTDIAGADADTKRLVAHTLREFRRAGVDRDDATRKRLAAIDDELTKLGQEWQKNIAGDVRHIVLKSADGLKGLPADYIAAHAADAKGEIRITTDYPDLVPFMTYAASTPHRKALYLENVRRGGEANKKVLRSILELRYEKARALGYANWADYITEDKMMKSGKNAAAFIDRVVKIARKRSKKDYRALLKRKRKEVKRAKRVEDYEKGYYEYKVKTENYALDPLKVREYFSYQQVEQGLLDITSKIFDISYVPVKNAQVWHVSVKAFDVMRGQTKLGRIYLDMHPRANKYKHAAQFTIANGVRGKQLPEGALVCNLPDPSKSEGPALMEHSDVVLMFHEFGHLMHHVLGGNQRWGAQSGVATEWDFVEAPSQVLEEWAWNHDTVKTVAKHRKTGEPISADLVDRTRKAKEFGLGLFTLQQMFYASLSLEFYSVDPAKLYMTKKLKQLQTKLTPFRYNEGTHMFTSFGHLNHYSAIYYTYMWSLVIAKDLLTPFVEHGLLDTEWTYKYRDAILVPGGTKDAADLVKDFLGRPFSYKAFEKYLGG